MCFYSKDRRNVTESFLVLLSQSINDKTELNKESMRVCKFTLPFSPPAQIILVVEKFELRIVLHISPSAINISAFNKVLLKK